MRWDSAQHLMNKWMIRKATHAEAGERLSQRKLMSHLLSLASFHQGSGLCAGVIANGSGPAPMELTLLELTPIRSSHVYWNSTFKYSSLRTCTHAEAIAPHCSLEIMVTVHLALFRKLGHEDFFQLPCEFVYSYCHLLSFLSCILYFSYPRR